MIGVLLDAEEFVQSAVLLGLDDLFMLALPRETFDVLLGELAGTTRPGCARPLSGVRSRCALPERWECCCGLRDGSGDSRAVAGVDVCDLLPEGQPIEQGVGRLSVR